MQVFLSNTDSMSMTLCNLTLYKYIELISESYIKTPNSYLARYTVHNYIDHDDD